MAPIRTPVTLLADLILDSYGRRWLRNALDAVDVGLMAPDTLRDLLIDLQAECAHVAPTGQRWPEALTNICTGQSDRPGRTARAFVLGGPTPPADGHSATEWSNLVEGDTWVRWHVDQSKPSPRPWPSFPVGQDTAALDEFEAFVQRPGWNTPSTDASGAWLGRPAAQGATCWVSTVELDAATGAPSEETQGSSRQVGWATGLRHTPQKARVRYRINAVALRAAQGCDGRRPTPADLPNGWFRTLVSGSRGELFNRQGWGTTVNLASVWGDHPETDGRPEQVIPSVRVDGGCIVGIDCILPATDDDNFTDPSDKFEVKLHDTELIKDITARLRERVERLFGTEPLLE